jgi:UPF0716 protein FxsA
MGPLLLILLLVVPVAELWFIVQVAGEIGALPTIGLLILVSVVGAWLLKQQGLATWQRMQATLRRGEMPAKEVTDGALILLGGALLLTPGFLTDVVGLLLVFPVTRAVIKSTFRKFLAKRVRTRFGVSTTQRPGTYETKVVKVERSARPKEKNQASSQLPGPERRVDEDGSPGTG